MDPLDVFTIVGAPARFGARILMFLQYLLYGYVAFDEWSNDSYARSRFGAHYQWRPWLLFDITDLERIEGLINEGSDEDIRNLLESQHRVFQIVAIVGALLTQAAISALSLPVLEHTHWCARGALTISLVISLLAIFFTCIQHRELRFIRRPTEFRVWLSDGVYEKDGQSALRSSHVAHQLLNMPYELVGLSITLFILGLGVYIGSAWNRKLGISVVHGESVGNAQVLVPFIVGTAFASSAFGYLMGQKHVENRRVEPLIRQLISEKARVGATQATASKPRV